jgi:hypothetical protein
MRLEQQLAEFNRETSESLRPDQWNLNGIRMDAFFDKDKKHHFESFENESTWGSCDSPANIFD